MTNGAPELPQYVFNSTQMNYSGKMHKLTYFVHSKAVVEMSKNAIL